MEFFERAHVVNSQDSKTEENVKKQLKQMLYGYKLGDNKLIQNSAEKKSEYNDDSPSVSGFSDLNLTNSSNEDNASQGIHLQSLNEVSAADLSSNISNTGPDAKDNDDSLSKQVETVDCLPEDEEFNNDSDGVISSMEDNSSLISGLLESIPDSNSSESFDASGKLAIEIHKRLQKINTKKVQHKRMYSYDEDNCCVPETSNKRKYVDDQESLEMSDVSSVISENIIENSDVMDNNPMSPPFVSITALDMPHQRLDEIVGDYKYSTIKNLSDNQHTISTNNSGFFVEETMSVDIHTEEEVGSLIPELDDVPTVEEIDEELKKLDTTFETNELETSIGSEVLSDTDNPLDNVEEIFKIYDVDKGCILVLKHPTELFINGKVKIKGLGGTVEVFGYTLKDNFCDVYAPYYNYAQCVRTVANPNAYYGLFGKLTAAGLTVAKSEEIVTSVGDQDGVILLQSLKNKAVEFVENNFKSHPLFIKVNRVVEPYFKNASDMLNCSLYSIKPSKTLHVHPSWKEALKHAENKVSRGIVCGGKGVGKSTYLRYQVNKLLAKGPVLVVDLDPGQCEFTVAGNVSATVVTTPLLGPNFTHLKKPDIMLNIGMINTMDNAKRYVSAVHALLTQCHQTEAYANMPWVINTMGMTLALGLKFITIIIILSKPTYLVQYDSEIPKKQFEAFLRPNIIKDLYEDFKKDNLFKNITCPADLDYSFIVSHETDSSVANGSMSARDERYLNFLAYFGELMNVHSNILGIVPYEVSLKDLRVGSNVIVKCDSVLKVINGRVVALCQQQECDSGGGVFTLLDKPLLCHGHGLVRGVDWEKELLYVITPISSSELCGVNTLMYADWAPDLVGHESQLPEGTVLPYRIKTQRQSKQLMSTPRRRFNPLQLLRMTRSAQN